MKKYSDSVGLDVSKTYFDAVLFHLGIHRRFVNDGRGFKGFRTWILDQGYRLEDVLVCFEHTGFYSLRLSIFLHDHGLNVAVRE